MESWAFQVQNLVISSIVVIGAPLCIGPSILFNALAFAWLPVLNLLILLFWLPSLICLLGIRFRDMYQLVPMSLQILFLITPILYESNRLGSLGWSVCVNPIYQIIAPIRSSILHRQLPVSPCLFMLLLNCFGVAYFVFLLNRERYDLPYLVNS